MLKPVCVPCKKFFKPKKNGFVFEEGLPVNISDRVEWGPYKLWVGDLYKCEGCGAEIVVGTPPDPVSEHYRPDYQEMLKRFPPQLRVEDC